MSTSSAQTVSEREQLIAALEKSFHTYLQVISSIPESAGGVKFNENSWTITQIAEHVAVAEHGMFRAMELGTPKTTPSDYELDQKIIAFGPNRQNKLQAPERALPKGRWATIAESVEAFKQARAKAIEFVRTAEDLRGKAVQHPLLGEIDGHQIFLIMAGHAERHAAQIEEIKRSAAYQNAAGR